MNVNVMWVRIEMPTLCFYSLENIKVYKMMKITAQEDVVEILACLSWHRFLK